MVIPAAMEASKMLRQVNMILLPDFLTPVTG
jgi:hypothetical protein